MEACAERGKAHLTNVITKNNLAKMHKLKLACRALSTTVRDTALPNLIHRYEALISGGFLKSDASQLRCLERLQILLEDLHLYGGKLKTYEQERTSYQLKRALAEEQIREELLKSSSKIIIETTTAEVEAVGIWPSSSVALLKKKMNLIFRNTMTPIIY